MGRPPSRDKAVEDAISTGELVDTTLDLIGFDTANPPGDTRDIVAWIEAYLEDVGLRADRVALDPSKPNLLARIPGERDATLLFCGHLDTVPFDSAAWSYAPLGERVENRIYGRGATDMKGAIASMLEVARAMKEAEATPPLTLLFAFVSDEEVGGDAGVKGLLETDRLAADACVIGEPTSARGRYSITLADRGSIWLTLEATGEPAHGSRPMLGVNAIDRLWEALETIRTRLGARMLSIPESVRPFVDESVEFYTPSMGEDTAHRLFNRPTINLGTIEGGESINAVPRRARADLDVRITPGIDTASILEDVRDCLDEHDAVEIADVSWSIGTYEEPASPLVRGTHGVVEDVLKEPVFRRCATGGGDAKRFRNAGIPCVEFAVGTDTVHAVDEYTTVSALLANAKVYAALPTAFSEAREQA